MKNFVLLILIFFTLTCNGQSYFWSHTAHTVPYDGSYPAYVDNGGIAAEGDFEVNVSYPATVNLNDILIAQLLDADNDAFATPAGWTLIYQEGANANASHAYFWKRATGDESGTQLFTTALSAGSGVYGVISRYSGCITSGTPYEDATGAAVTQTSTPTIPAMTATAGGRLAVGFVTIEDNITLTGHSGYTNAYQEMSVFGGDANLAGAHQQTDGNIASDALSLASAEYTGILGILLIPAE